MIPTPRLRFVERVVLAPEHGNDICKTIRILQQWWAIDPNDEDDFIQRVNGYWQDITLENEND
jgi:hypothetical protein